MKYFLLVAVSLLYSFNGFATCKEASVEDLKNHTSRKNAIYFASWCQSCVDSIKASDPENDLYIAVFDEQKTASVALEFVLKDQTKKAVCIWDKTGDIARVTKVKNLPKTQSMNIIKGFLRVKP